MDERCLISPLPFAALRGELVAGRENNNTNEEVEENSRQIEAELAAPSENKGAVVVPARVPRDRIIIKTDFETGEHLLPAGHTEHDIKDALSQVYPGIMFTNASVEQGEGKIYTFDLRSSNAK